MVPSLAPGQKFQSTILIGAIALSGLGSCSDRVEVGSNQPTSAGAGTAAGGGGNGGSGGGEPVAGRTTGGGPPCEPSECLGKTYLCGNCEDDDRDGLVDANDPDCLGPCDNTEDSYFGGIPGQNNSPCRQDCYFDRDTGSGNDECTWSQACDPRSLGPDYPPSGIAACAYDPSTVTAGQACTDPQPDVCRATCLPLAPNGCDCFGCCELPARSGKFVWIGSESAGQGTCDATRVDDPAACKPCTPVPSCFNTCEACEVCVGTTSVAPNCGDSSPTCDFDRGRCSAVAGCNVGEYC
ncbi:MAG TPA: hypothetical protein VIM73_09990, partial [Polyangiaceae bacterium]